MKSAVVIIPTIGSPETEYAISSVLEQTYENTICYVVIDGPEHFAKCVHIVDKFRGNFDKLRLMTLPENVGRNGYYGHRTYAAVSHLVNQDYVMYLDPDNYFDPEHVELCVNKIEQNNLDWCYSLRKIVDKQGNFLVNDDCESLGKWLAWTNGQLIDTSCYCIKREVAVQVASVWHGGWGRDRIFANMLMTNFKQFDCTNKYTLNYRLGGNEGSVNKEFFIKGNEVMMNLYGNYPWSK